MVTVAIATPAVSFSCHYRPWRRVHVCTGVCTCDVYNAAVASLCQLQKNNREGMTQCCERNWASCSCEHPACVFIYLKYKHIVRHAFAYVPAEFPFSPQGEGVPDVMLSERGNGYTTNVELVSLWPGFIHTSVSVYGGFFEFICVCRWGDIRRTGNNHRLPHSSI